MFERSIAEELKLRKVKIAKIERGEKSSKLFKEYFTN